MKDINGKEVNVGDKAVLLKSDLGLKGKIGTVRAVTDDSAIWKGEPTARIADGPDDNPKWSSWCRSKHFSIVG